MQKNFIIDTNVMIHDPYFMYKFEDNNIIIPLICIEELDKLKSANGLKGYQTREALREINKLRKQGPLEEGVALPGGGSLRVEMNHADFDHLPDALDQHKNDNKILAITYNLAQLNKEKDQVTILVSKDLAMSIKADSLGLAVEDYQNDKVDVKKLYEGFHELSLSTDQISTIYQDGLALDQVTSDLPLYPNHFLHVKDYEKENHQSLCKVKDGLIVPLQHGKDQAYGLKPLNREQKFAFEMLMDDDIRLCTLAGGAGSGKTIMATAAALEHYFSGKYSKIIFVRPVVAAGDDIGFLPGNEEEKLRPWMGPFFDSIETLLFLRGQRHKGMDQGPEAFVEQLKQVGGLEVKTFNYMRGRTLDRAIVIIDEAQQITPHLAKLMLTRAGAHAKFIFLGDPTDNQIDSVLVDAKSNGLVYLIDKMKGHKITAHVTLQQVERSELAMIAEESL